jgi:gamma-glutamyl-gamma-aminobutyrate hydrolase PuuD
MRLASAVYNGAYPFENMNGVASVAQVDHPSDLTTNDILIIWGGGDIHPSLYNKLAASKSGAYLLPSRRDVCEWDLLQRAIKLGIPTIGICRGAQMLCAVAGGYLIQDVTGHAGNNHAITTVNGDRLHVNSIHHQMMAPWGVEHELLAWSSDTLSRHYLDVTDDGVDSHVSVPCEPELVYFPKVRGLAAQWHPEMMDENSAATQYLMSHIYDKFMVMEHA